ncbi:MAG: DUF47 family protein [Candidatus Altiarchaeota archaeon]
MPDMFRWRNLLREKKIYDMFTSHVELTHEGISLVSKAVVDLCNQQYKKEDVLIDKVVKIEKEAAEIVAHATKTIAQSRLTSVEAHDLLDLVFHIDKVAKKTKGSAIRLDWAEGVVVPQDIKNEFIKIGEKLVEIFETLQKAIESLAKDEIKKTIEYADRVSEIEDEIDEIRRTAQKRLLDLSDEMKYGDVRKLEEVIDYLEATADFCEDAADTIRLIIIKRKD